MVTKLFINGFHCHTMYTVIQCCRLSPVYPSITDVLISLPSPHQTRSRKFDYFFLTLPSPFSLDTVIYTIVNGRVPWMSLSPLSAQSSCPEKWIPINYPSRPFSMLLSLFVVNFISWVGHPEYSYQIFFFLQILVILDSVGMNTRVQREFSIFLGGGILN